MKPSAAWTCATCERANTETSRFCGFCGEARQDTTAPPRHRALIPPWERPDFTPSRPDDVCSEPGCSLTVREHIDACKRLTERVMLRVITL